MLQIKFLRKFNRNYFNAKGFTLVEIVLSIAILGILSVAVISVVNQRQQQERAQDAVRRSRMEQLTLALESFYGSEGRYPAEAGGVPSDENLSFFITNWPAEIQYRVSGDNEDFAIFTPQSDANFMKYSTALNSIEICGSASIDDIFVCQDPYGYTPPAPTLTAIEVTPTDNDTVIGGTFSLTALAVYSDSSKVDVTHDAGTTWSEGVITGLPVIDVSNTEPKKGLVTGLSLGTQDAVATYSGQSGTASVTVSNIQPPVTLLSIDVLPSSASIEVGQQVQLKAYAVYSDGTKPEITTDSGSYWHVDTDTGFETDVISVSNNGVTKGLTTGIGIGVQNAIVEYGGEKGSSAFTVSSAGGTTLTSIDLTPITKDVAVGSTYNFLLTATYADGSKVNITTNNSVVWTTLNNVLPVNFSHLGAGLVRGARVGDGILKATFQGFSDESTVNVVTACTNCD